MGEGIEGGVRFVRVEDLRVCEAKLHQLRRDKEGQLQAKEEALEAVRAERDRLRNELGRMQGEYQAAARWIRERDERITQLEGAIEGSGETE